MCKAAVVGNSNYRDFTGGAVLLVTEEDPGSQADGEFAAKCDVHADVASRLRLHPSFTSYRHRQRFRHVAATVIILRLHEDSDVTMLCVV